MAGNGNALESPVPESFKKGRLCQHSRLEDERPGHRAPRWVRKFHLDNGENAVLAFKESNSQVVMAFCAPANGPRCTCLKISTTRGGVAMGELARYDAACRALAEAWKVDEVKDIRNKALAMQTYAKQANDRVLIDHATDIRLRAEIKAGEMLAEMRVRGERQKPADAANTKRRHGSNATPCTRPTLGDLGVTKTQSSRWQKLAALPKAEQEDVIAGAKHKAQVALDVSAKRKPKPSQEIDKDPISSAAIDCAVAVRGVVLEAMDKMKPAEVPDLLITLGDEWRDLKVIIKRHATPAVEAETEVAARLNDDGLDIPPYLDQRTATAAAAGPAARDIADKQADPGADACAGKRES